MTLYVFILILVPRQKIVKVASYIITEKLHRFCVISVSSLRLKITYFKFSRATYSHSPCRKNTIGFNCYHNNNCWSYIHTIVRYLLFRNLNQRNCLGNYRYIFQIDPCSFLHYDMVNQNSHQ